MKNIYILLIVGLGFVIMAFTANIETKEEVSIDTEVGVYEPIVVLELFTSQGCSSCPSADRLLQQVKKEYQNEVFALSYHVDYWNYIGWEDPFSDAKYARKQRKYNIKFRNNSNYTPQVVVNGKEHFVGSSATKLYTKIKGYSKVKSANKIELNKVNNSADKVAFNYEVAGAIENKVLRALLVIDQRSTNVKRGENRNKTLHNSNIVVSEKIIPLSTDNGHVDIAIPEVVTTADKLNLIVLVERENYDITGAVKQHLGE